MTKNKEKHTYGMSLSIVVISGGLFVAKSPMYSSKKPKSFCGTQNNIR